MINISGISESRTAPVAAYLCRQKDKSIIIVSTDVRAKRLALDLSFFVKDREIMVLPGEEPFFLRYDAKNHDQMIERLKALKALRTGQPAVVIAPVSAAVKNAVAVIYSRTRGRRKFCYTLQVGGFFSHFSAVGIISAEHGLCSGDIIL